MTTRMAEMIIKDYIADLPEPNCRCRFRRAHFSQRSYSIWAAEEVLRTIRKRKDVSPIYAVEEFVNRMEYFACKRPSTSYIFSVAYDIGIDILDILIAAN